LVVGKDMVFPGGRAMHYEAEKWFLVMKCATDKVAVTATGLRKSSVPLAPLAAAGVATPRGDLRVRLGLEDDASPQRHDLGNDARTLWIDWDTQKNVTKSGVGWSENRMKALFWKWPTERPLPCI
jgi:hypothetical protein